MNVLFGPAVLCIPRCPYFKGPYQGISTVTVLFISYTASPVLGRSDNRADSSVHDCIHRVALLHVHLLLLHQGAKSKEEIKCGQMGVHCLEHNCGSSVYVSWSTPPAKPFNLWPTENTYRLDNFIIGDTPSCREDITYEDIIQRNAVYVGLVISFVS